MANIKTVENDLLPFEMDNSAELGNPFQKSSDEDWENAPRIYLEIYGDKAGILTLYPSVKSWWDGIVRNISNLQSELTLTVKGKGYEVTSEEGVKLGIIYGKPLMSLEGMQAAFKLGQVHFSSKEMLAKKMSKWA